MSDTAITLETRTLPRVPLANSKPLAGTEQAYRDVNNAITGPSASATDITRTRCRTIYHAPFPPNRRHTERSYDA